MDFLLLLFHDAIVLGAGNYWWVWWTRQSVRPHPSVTSHSFGVQAGMSTLHSREGEIALHTTIIEGIVACDCIYRIMDVEVVFVVGACGSLCQDSDGKVCTNKKNESF